MWKVTKSRGYKQFITILKYLPQFQKSMLKIWKTNQNKLVVIIFAISMIRKQMETGAAKVVAHGLVPSQKEQLDVNPALSTWHVRYFLLSKAFAQSMCACGCAGCSKCEERGG